jgi:uncharacterized protein (TIGR02270 family)
MQIPLGFRPWEISALVNREIVARHAGDAAFLWSQRHGACSEPHYTLLDLQSLDERVEANLEGLRVAADRGWEACRASLESMSVSEVFAMSAVAFSSGRREWMRDALFAACSQPEFQAGLVSALGWLSFDTVSPWLSLLLRSSAPQHRRIAIAAYAIHRCDPGPPLSAAVNDPDAGLRSRALRAVGELRRQDLLGVALDHLRDEDADCRFWSAWSVTLLGRREALSDLRRVVEAAEPHQCRALELVIRAMHAEESRSWVSSIASRGASSPMIVMATGMVGDPVAVEWLIDRMSVPLLAKLAGEAFASMCGVDLEFQDLVHDQPDDAPADPESDDADPVMAPESGVVDRELQRYEGNLPVPAPPLIAAWWQENRQRFISGTRYLSGRPVSVDAARSVLVTGKQRQRRAAAFELVCLDATAPFYEVRARGARQVAQLMSSWPP